MQRWILASVFVVVFGLSFSSAFSDTAPQPSASKPIFISDFQGIGPFLSAPFEGSLDPVWFDLRQEFLNPSTKSLHSVLAKGGSVSWFPVKNESGHSKVVYSNVDWPLLRRAAGLSSVMSQGYFYAELDRPTAGNLLAITKNVGEFFVNGERFFGEPYRFSFHKVAIPLREGKNQILLKVSSYEDTNFDFSLEVPSQSLEILDDMTFPDLIEGEVAKEIWLGVPIINTTNQWIRKFKVHLKGGDSLALGQFENSFSIAPLSVLKVPILLTQKNPFQSTEKPELALQIISQGDVIGEKVIPFAVRSPKKGESVRETFRSQIDGSVQYFSIRWPLHFDSLKTYPGWVSLHGANVEASELIDNISSKDWAFVIAPNNRRPHGFAYQDLGRRDVLEAIQVAESRHPIRKNAIFLGGHSMGGQGTWHLGVHHPSKFVGLAPSAGWTTMSMYIPSEFQKGELTGDPEILSFRNRVLLDSMNPAFIQNAKHLPVYITQSSRDDNVPALHSRIYNSLVSNERMKSFYREIDSDQHCQVEPLIEGRGWNCIDEPQQYEFLRQNEAKSWPKKLDFRLVDLSIEKDFYWIRVEEQEKIFSETKVKAEILGRKVQIETTNVKALSLWFPPELEIPNLVEINWNGRKASLHLPVGQSLTMQFAKNEIVFTKAFEPKQSELHSIKSLLLKPALIVYGTSGTAEEQSILFRSARLLSQKAWRSANAFVPVLADYEVSDHVLRNRNLILLGSADRNRLTKRFAGELPIKVSRHDIRLGRDRMQASESGLAAAFIFPNPKSKSFLMGVFEGTTAEAESYSIYFNPLFDRQGFSAPDFLIFSGAVRHSGWAAVQATGFFSENWELSNHDFVVRKSY